MSEPASQAPKVLLVTGDLMFTSQVEGAARHVGVTVEVASAKKAPALAGREEYGCVLVDLGAPGLELEALVAVLKGRASAHGATGQFGSAARVIAFGSHVDVETLKKARAAGCDEVMPRSRFHATLAKVLRSCLGES